MNSNTLKHKLENNSTIIPVADIFETPSGYKILLEMPGVNREKIDVVLNDDELEITGVFSAEFTENNHDLAYSEFSPHDYKRKFRIGADIDRNSIEAHLDNGVLSVTLDKAEEAKPRKIEVKAG